MDLFRTGGGCIDRAANMNPCHDKIEAMRREQGKRLLILGHHYQRDSVLAHADVTGDSLELARRAAREHDAGRIVFCGVHFMAESADILTSAGQAVYMPERDAGCPMANMADLPSVRAVWDVLQSHEGDSFLPVAYVNSSAEIKAFCGANGGVTCTSSNCGRVFNWVFGQHRRVFFLPDEHLGRNTAHDLGVDDDEIAVVGRDGSLASRESARPDVSRPKVVLWKGFCLVHVRFTVEQVKAVRQNYPGARIIVHPETPREVVELCDAHGSTSQIIDYVNAAPAGSTVIVGTEVNLVERLARQSAGRVRVKTLAPSVCANMNKTSAESLMNLLEKWPESSIVRVPASDAALARVALERMLAI